MILLCQARARGDLTLETFEVVRADQAMVKRLPCRIERALRWSHDVLGVFLRLPAAESFDFAAGQYLDVLLSGGRRRSFSIASPPHDAPLLELHIRRVEGGEFTAALFDGDPRGRLIQIQGPLGAFTLRPSAAPLLLLGGGTGLAPLKSMVLDQLARDPDRVIRLYWGVRAERDLYAHAEFIELSRRAPGLDYRAVLSEPGADWRGRRGYVHEAVLEDWPRLDGFDVYASGPPAMIEAMRREFPLHGADPARSYFDSFDYAPDSRERQRIKADTKS
jgi:CDP-4-dehydro-6-deoxyglucose reductase